MNERRDWWDQAPRKGASAAPLVSLATAVAIVGGGLYFGLRSGAQPANDAPAASAAPSAVEDPTTREPIVLGARTPEGDRIFSSRFLDFAVALDRASKAGSDAAATEELARTEAAFSAPDAVQVLGANAASALAEVASAAKAAGRASAEDEPTATALDLATARLDNLLLAGRLPYFADTSVILNRETGARLVLLYGFGVEATLLHTSLDVRVRSVRVRRLDRSNWRHTLLGFVNHHRAQAMILLDQIDEELAEGLLPALADGAPMPMLPPGEKSDSPEGKAIEAQGGKDLRSDVAGIPGLDQARARELGDALRARRALFVKSAEVAKSLGMSVKFPRGLAFDVNALEKESAGALPGVEFRELRRLQERLARPELKRAYDVFLDAFIASIERHEVQHRLDLLRPLPALERIDSIVPRGRGLTSDRIRDKIRAETSAYLAELARDDLLAHTTFARLMQFVVNPAMRGTPESYATLIVLEELTREMKVADVAPLFHDHAFDLGRFARAHQKIAATSSEDLRGAAARSWSRLFHMSLAPLTGPTRE